MVRKVSKPSKEWLDLTRLEQVLYISEHLGWKIIPIHGVVEGVCTCGSPHADGGSKIGKHPSVSDWPMVATSDPDVLRGWFSPTSVLNYGIYMRGSGLVAIDIDVKAGGWSSWQQLDERCMYDFLPTVEVETGLNSFGGKYDRGAHKYYLPPADFKFASNLTKAGFPSIDLRHNAYVIGPGSTHASGITYNWKAGHAPWELEIPELPTYSLGYLGRMGKPGETHTPTDSLGDEVWQASWVVKISASVDATPYAKVALKNSCAELSSMGPGSGRNNALNAKAFAMGRLIGGGQLGFPEAYKSLKAAAEKAYGGALAHKNASIEKTLRSWGGGFECGAMEPRFPNELPAVTLDWLQNLTPSNSLAELENADDVIGLANQGFFGRKGELRRETLEKAIRWVGSIGVGPAKTLWSYSDGYWKPNGRDEVIYRAGRLLGEAARPGHSQNLIHFMEVEPQLIYDLGPIDFLNLQNGMLNWMTGEMVPHCEEYNSTVQLPMSWNQNAVCPTVDGFIGQVVHADLIDLIWEILGICILTGPGFQKAILLDGLGRNGKGAFLRLIEKMIPPEFVANVDLQSLMKDKFAKAQLFGKIVSIVGDMSAKALEDTSIFKQLTGQDSVSAEFKYGQPFSFTSQATLIFAANQLPPTTDFTKGFYSRLLIVPFDKVSLEDHEIDNSLEPRMHLELEGVLVKAVEGLRRAMARGGFDEVSRCEEALQKYKGEQSIISDWWDSEVTVTGDPKDRVSRSAMYDSYTAFAHAKGVKPESRMSLFSRVRKDYAAQAQEIKSGDNYFVKILIS